MFPALRPPARWTAAAIALVALASVAGIARAQMISQDQSLGEAAWVLARFFTILTNLLVALTFATAATRRQGVDGAWLAALTLAIVMVGLVYHALLAGLVEFTTTLGALSNQGLHSVVPSACALWWLVYAPKRGLTYADLPIFALWPSIYVAYALGRGAQDGIYPYPFMDPVELGAAVVAVNLAGLTILLLLGGVILVSIGRFADR